MWDVLFVCPLLRLWQIDEAQLVLAACGVGVELELERWIVRRPDSEREPDLWSWSLSLTFPRLDGSAAAVPLHDTPVAQVWESV
jgi:hypothetical protein